VDRIQNIFGGMASEDFGKMPRTCNGVGLVHGRRRIRRDSRLLECRARRTVRFRLREHLERLARSMKMVRLPLPYSVEQLTDAIIDLFARE